MSGSPRIVASLLAAALLLGGLASAQSTTTPPAAGSATQQANLQSLERQAARLTLVNSLPAADRAQATQLLDRADALRQRALSLRAAELQAYIAALQAGDAPMTARVQAQQKVADTRLALTKDVATLRSDVQAFVQKVPQARALLRELGGYGRGYGRGYGPGADLGGLGFGGRGFGSMPGMQGIRPGAGAQGGMGWRWGGPGASRMPNAGQSPWGRGGAPRGPGGWNGMPQNRQLQNNQPQNSTPQNSTPPSSGGGA